MSVGVFGSAYAEQYDLLYRDKDYASECDVLAEIFRRYATAPVRTVLDLGCGTGNHSWPLARRGYEVTGVDRSTAMLERARNKAPLEPPGDPAPRFVEGNVQDVDLGRRFDAVLMMFAVLGYQLANDDVSKALATVRRHLNPGGLFVCDVWYGPAVLAIRPGERVKTTSAQEGTIIRAASTSLDSFAHVAEVTYRVWRLGGSTPAVENVEAHRMRYFFPQELELFLRHAGLRPLHWSSFDDLDRRPGEGTWNVFAVASTL